MTTRSAPGASAQAFSSIAFGFKGGERRRTARIDGAGAEDGEFLVGARDGKGEALAVVECVRVQPAPDLLAGGVKAARFGDGGIDLQLGVDGRCARHGGEGGGALSRFELRGVGGRGHSSGEG